jgi:hypothetical protein
MSESSSIHSLLQQRFAAVFGAPHRTVGKDSQWSLTPRSKTAAINVLINGSPEFPAIWVFDPHDLQDGVGRFALTSKAEVDSIIAGIEQRLKRAALQV